MLIQTNTDIVVTVLDLMHVYHCRDLTLAEVKRLLFLEWIIVLQCMLMLIKKDTLVFGEGLTQRLGNTTITAEAKNPFKFTKPGIKFVLRLHYNGSNSFVFVNNVKTYQFKAKDLEIKPYSLCFMKNTGLKGYKNTKSFTQFKFYLNHL